MKRVWWMRGGWLIGLAALGVSLVLGFLGSPVVRLENRNSAPVHDLRIGGPRVHLEKELPAGAIREFVVHPGSQLAPGVTFLGNGVLRQQTLPFIDETGGYLLTIVIREDFSIHAESQYGIFRFRRIASLPRPAPEEPPRPRVQLATPPKEPVERYIDEFNESAKSYIAALAGAVKKRREQTQHDFGPLDMTYLSHPTLEASVEDEIGILGVTISSNGFALPEGLIIGKSGRDDVLRLFGPGSAQPENWFDHDPKPPHLHYYHEDLCPRVINFVFDERDVIRRVQLANCIP